MIVHMECYLWENSFSQLPFPFSDLSPSGQWELGTVLEDEKVLEGYEERFFAKFPDLYKHQVWSMLLALKYWPLYGSRILS